MLSRMYYIKKDAKFTLEVLNFLLNNISFQTLSAQPTLLLCLYHNIVKGCHLRASLNKKEIQ